MLDFGNCDISLLLLIDNYNQTDMTTRKGHEGTKDAQSDSWWSSSLAILAIFRKQRRAAARPWRLPLSGSRLSLLVRRLWARAVRARPRYCPCGLACQISARDRRQEAGWTWVPAAQHLSIEIFRLALCRIKFAVCYYYYLLSFS